MTDTKPEPSAPAYYPTVGTTPSDSVKEHVRISFCDGKSFSILKAFTEKYPKISAAQSIDRMSGRFEKYILPVLLGYQLVGLSFDTDQEIQEFIDEVKYYDIQLTDKQLWNVFESSGLIDSMMKIKSYLARKSSNGKMKKSVQERINNFDRYWQEYIAGAANHGFYTINTQGESFTYIQVATILKLIGNNNVKSLLLMNFSYDNIISVFVNQFIKFVMEKNPDDINRLLMQCSVAGTLIGTTVGSAIGSALGGPLTLLGTF